MGILLSEWGASSGRLSWNLSHFLEVFAPASDTVLSWKDNWSEECLTEKFACLFSYARNEDISIEKYCDLGSIGDGFFTPISPEPLVEMQEIDELIIKADISLL